MRVSGRVRAHQPQQHVSGKPETPAAVEQPQICLISSSGISSITITHPKHRAVLLPDPFAVFQERIRLPCVIWMLKSFLQAGQIPFQRSTASLSPAGARRSRHPAGRDIPWDHDLSVWALCSSLSLLHSCIRSLCPMAGCGVLVGAHRPNHVRAVLGLSCSSEDAAAKES